MQALEPRKRPEVSKKRGHMSQDRDKRFAREVGT